MKLTDNSNGHEFEAGTPEQLVFDLWKSSWSAADSATAADYMTTVARRVGIADGAECRVDTARHFLEDLEAVGAITVDWSNEDVGDAHDRTGLSGPNGGLTGVGVGDRWYFAYGSNLEVDRKVERTGHIRSTVRCRLPGIASCLTSARLRVASTRT